MATERRAANDPRTVARDIPGIFDALFPQLTPGMVAHFNRKSYAAADSEPVSAELVAASNLQRAMLFEVAVAAVEQLIAGNEPVDWDVCLAIAVCRQRRHFDAKLPDALSTADKAVAQRVARNLVVMLNQIEAAGGDEVLVRSPYMPGYQWMPPGSGTSRSGHA